MREVIERALRRGERAYPSVAVRELIANALIHQDLHTYGASVMIELYADRLEISNPGQPDIQFDRIRACYQHCCLRYVSGELMTNQSLRERFRLSESQYGSVSHVLAATQAAGQIKMDSSTAQSKRYARYLPFWA